ncbi:MAG: aldehyde dehydrogenase (NADP(+)) [Pirellulales bacterium]|nr:aldehyde dehydrogenase (NADP(+)) [Pirellulales bacterium]
MPIQPVLINGQWRTANHSGTFQAANPASGEKLADEYPISTWGDIDEALNASQQAFEALRQAPHEKIAVFLERFADLIEARSAELVELANRETALPSKPRLADVELPRTTGQLRQAAAAARSSGWARPTIDTGLDIRSCLEPIGPVCVFGPNNFPFAFGSASGGDFAAAIAAGNPVIAKANSSHPGTTRIFAEQALAALEESQLPKATVQLLYRTSHEDGERMVADPRVAATGYTGSRGAGLALKAAADQAGKPIYLELSSINPVVILPGALQERGTELVDEFTTSCLMGTGQFCTNPGLVVTLDDDLSRSFASKVAAAFDSAAAGTLLSQGVQHSLAGGVDRLLSLGAERMTEKTACEDASGFRCPNTVLSATGQQFLADADGFQTELFGNASLFLFCEDETQMANVLQALEGNLTGCVYSAKNGVDDETYGRIAPLLRARVGRLLNDKMPTGVAVTAAMNHGGPYPATGHSGFTAVGMPRSIERFATLACYDNVRPDRLPDILRDQCETPGVWRLVDGTWQET